MPWLLRHPRILIALVGTFLIAVGGGAVAYLNLRNVQRIEAIQTRLADLERIRELRHRLEISLLDEVREAVPAGSFLATDVRLQVETVLTLESFLEPSTAARLRQLRDLLSRPGLVTRSTLVSALELAGEIQQVEADAQRDLLTEIRSDGEREFVLGLAVLLALSVLTALTAWLLPRRFLSPLAALRQHFVELPEGRFQAIAVEGVDPGLLPLFRKYNAMVERMAELEEERRSRAENLEEEVRVATRALVEHQRTLADAQKMAAVGETAARVAHELRNPLAGLLASLENLRRDVEDPSTLQRVKLLHAETERVVRLLNDYLAAARHEPEPLQATDLRELVRDLLDLLRYQVPGTVTLEERIPPNLICTLPRNRVRQVLLNLVWNAVEAVEDRRGTVVLQARSEEGRAILEVRDDGPGFPEELLSGRIQAFRSRRPGGTGLGLAIAERTIRDLGGSLALANPETGGASVRLFLPCEREDEE